MPQGIHNATWEEFADRFGISNRRKDLLVGLEKALTELKRVGCKTVYIDGSFVSNKLNPDDYDGCWDVTGVDINLMDPILMDFDNSRATQKAKYKGEFFPSISVASRNGDTFLDFFQTDKDTGDRKGIIEIDLETLNND